MLISGVLLSVPVTCCTQGDIEKLKMLIGARADVNTKDNAGWTPLHEACNHNHVDIACYLIKCNANVDDPG